MADTKISALTAVAAALGAQELACNDAGTTKKVTIDQLQAALQLVGYKAANENVEETTTLALDGAVVVTVEAGETYWFSILGHFNDLTTAGAGGLKVSIGGTATATNLVAEAKIIANDTPALANSARFTALDQTVAVTAAGASLAVEISGTIEVNAGGTFGLKWSQSVSVIDGVTILRGSTIRCEK